MMPVAKCCRVGELEAGGADDPDVLQVALAPAPVARGEIDQRRRAFLVAAGEIRQHVDRPARPAHEGRLDEVVAEDVPAEGRAAGQVRQAAMGREGARADDGVVAPVVAVPAGPGRETGGDHRAVDMGRELLGAREQGVAVDDQRQASG